jgi:ribonuclease HI
MECPLCTRQDEEEWHIFLECEATKEAWHNMGLFHTIQARMNTCHNICDLIFDICRNEDKQIAGKVAVMFWCMWQNRNKYVWNNNKISAQQIGMQAEHIWHEWAMVQGLLDDQQHDEQLLVGDSPALQQWLPPPLGFVKCNVDASFFPTDGATGWGWCVRDHRGRFLFAGTNIMQAQLNTLEGEAMAIKEAMEELIQRGLSCVIFESDSKIVVDAISSRHVGISEYSVLISDIKLLLAANPNFEVKFVKRQTNMVAHSLARATYSMSSRSFFDSIPRCINHYLLNEMN